MFGVAVAVGVGVGVGVAVAACNVGPPPVTVVHLPVEDAAPSLTPIEAGLPPT